MAEFRGEVDPVRGRGVPLSPGELVETSWRRSTWGWDEDQHVRGMYILAVDDPAGVDAFVHEDPALVNGVLQLEPGSVACWSVDGLGVPEPYPSWGRMLSVSAAEYAQKAPHLVIFPGLAISLAVFGSNLLGDALRDTLDPRLRGR